MTASLDVRSSAMGRASSQPLALVRRLLNKANGHAASSAAGAAAAAASGGSVGDRVEAEA